VPIEILERNIISQLYSHPWYFRSIKIRYLFFVRWTLLCINKIFYRNNDKHRLISENAVASAKYAPSNEFPHRYHFPLMSRQLAIQIGCHLESGDFGENGTNGEKSPEAAEIQNVANIQIGCQKRPLGEWRFWRKWRFWQKRRKIVRGLARFRMWQKFKLDAKSGPLESGNFGENGEFGINGEKSPEGWWDLERGKYSNWMQKVAPWRVPILAKFAKLTKIRQRWNL